MRWFAISVNSRHEKAVETHLTSRSLTGFAPVYHARRRWSDRVKEVEVPLFPGYVFCRFAFADRLKVIGAPGVRGIVGFAGKPTPIPDLEIESVKMLIASGHPVSPAAPLTAGQPVRISEGALAGVEGIVVREKSCYRVVVKVELLNRAVQVELDRLSVEKAPKARTANAPFSF